jgi:hypothetical protein
MTPNFDTNKWKAKNMNTIQQIAYTGALSISLAIMTPSMGFAESEHTSVKGSNSGNSIHRISHSIASEQHYTGGSNAGSKWGKKIESDSPQINWAESGATRAGNKWANSSTRNTESQPFAGTSAYQFQSMSFSEQTANKWGRRNFSEQTANKWGRR